MSQLEYRPTDLAVYEYKRRCDSLGVKMREFVPSYVNDHHIQPAVVYAPTPIHRCSKSSSGESEDWLKYMEGMTKVPIWREGNGLEVQIQHEGGSSNVDGYCPLTLTVYEYQGEHWHPNPLVHDFTQPFSTSGKRTASLVTSGASYDNDCSKVHHLQACGYRVVTIWASEWQAFRKSMETPRKRRGKSSVKGYVRTPSSSGSSISDKVRDRTPGIAGASTPSPRLMTPCSSSPSQSSSSSSPSPSKSPTRNEPSPRGVKEMMKGLFGWIQPSPASPPQSQSPSSDAVVPVSSPAPPPAPPGVSMMGESKPSLHTESEKKVDVRTIFCLIEGRAFGGTSRPCPIIGIYCEDWASADPRTVEFFSTDQTVSQYVALRLSTRLRTIGESLSSIAPLFNCEVELPFQVKGMTSLTVGKFCRRLHLAVALAEILFPNLPSQENWEVVKRPAKEITEEIRASLGNAAREHSSDLVELMGKKESLFEYGTPKGQAVQRFIASVLRTAFGSSYVRQRDVGVDDWAFITPTGFRWDTRTRVASRREGGCYRPVLEFIPTTTRKK